MPPAYLKGTCRKRPYGTLREANDSLLHLLRSPAYVRPRGKVLNVYQCKCCGQIHVGHVRFYRI